MSSLSIISTFDNNIHLNIIISNIMKFWSSEYFKPLEGFAVGKSIDYFKKNISMEVPTFRIMIDNWVIVKL